MAEITDFNGRKINYARISVTDRCNYRCLYCMPESGVAALSHDQVLRYEDIMFLCEALSELGVTKLRFTGGEPLVRKGLVPFLRELKGMLPSMAISLTTNAALLGEYARELAAIGLASMNISLDTIDAERFANITRVGNLADVLKGIDAAVAAGIGNIKTNTVLIRGFNDDELSRIVEYAWSRNLLPRFIEFMPIGDDVWRQEKFIGAAEILEKLKEFGSWFADVGLGEKVPLGPAKYYINDGNRKRVGIIEAVSNHFCADCNRLRITAVGNMKACLFNSEELSLMSYIRAQDGEGLKRTILRGINAKPDCWKDTRDGLGQMSRVGG